MSAQSHSTVYRWRRCSWNVQDKVAPLLRTCIERLWIRDGEGAAVSQGEREGMQEARWPAPVLRTVGGQTGSVDYDFIRMGK